MAPTKIHVGSGDEIEQNVCSQRKARESTAMQVFVGSRLVFLIDREGMETHMANHKA